MIEGRPVARPVGMGRSARGGSARDDTADRAELHCTPRATSPSITLTGGPHFAACSERYIRHTKGRWAGQPLVFEAWQREFWWEALEFDPATGLRIYDEVGLGLPRKNSKSTMASGAGLYGEIRRDPRDI